MTVFDMTNIQTTELSEQPKDLELFLLTLRYREGRLLDAEGNRPLPLDDGESVWVVYRGKVDVFAVRMHDGETVGARQHLFRIEAGQLLFGIPSAHDGLGLLAAGTAGTQVLRLAQSRLRELASDAAYAEIIATLVDAWLTNLSSGFADASAPKNVTLLEHGDEIGLSDKQVALTKRGVLWVKILEGGARLLNRTDLPTIDAGQVLPLCKQTWLQAQGSARVQAENTTAYLAEDSTWSALADFHARALAAIRTNAQQRETSERARLQNKADAERTVIEGAVQQLASLLAPEVAPTIVAVHDESPLLAASRLVARALNMELQAPPSATLRAKSSLALKAIAQASKFRVRQVALKGEWWQHDHGALLAFTEKGSSPSRSSRARRRATSCTIRPRARARSSRARSPQRSHRSRIRSIRRSRSARSTCST